MESHSPNTTIFRVLGALTSPFPKGIAVNREHKTMIPKQVLEARKPWKPGEMVDTNGSPIVLYARYRILTWRLGWVNCFITGAEKSESGNLYIIYFMYEVYEVDENEARWHECETVSLTPQFDNLLTLDANDN